MSLIEELNLSGVFYLLIPIIIFIIYTLNFNITPFNLIKTFRFSCDGKNYMIKKFNNGNIKIYAKHNNDYREVTNQIEKRFVLTYFNNYTMV